MSIQGLGWDGYFEAQWNIAERIGCVPARVVSRHRGRWRVAGDFPECWAESSGKLRLATEAGAEWPAVGDWVAAQISVSQASAAIQDVLPRRSAFVRKSPGKGVAEQVIAANIDVAVIVTGLDGDFNLRRIERYVAQCWESGAKPVIVLNKADVCADAGRLAAQVEAIATGVPVFVASATTGDGVRELKRSFAKGQTIVLLGSSGVGKSTLLNCLLLEERQRTQAVRESDSRGRHTTTWQELFVLPGGALIIDTPGLRELHLWNASEGLSQAFADIEGLAARCRFRDCLHETEPGCAVQAAIASGVLDAERFENKRKLQREQEFLQRKQDPEVRSTAQKRMKALQRSARRLYETREKGKG
jgi:ribosome biogenesis GTPase / thiamine phosphate phosphatase